MAVAAYASLVSFMDVLDNVQHLGRRRRLHLDKEQIQNLQEKVQFLQDFLEVHSQRISPEMENLARQLVVLVDVADDIIDFHVANQLREGSQDKSLHVIALTSFCQYIDKIIEKIDSITDKLMMVKEEQVDVQEQQLEVSMPVGSTALPYSDENTMVGFDERLLQVVDELTRDESNLQILPIVGMGGIGKTTLAQNAFDHPYIVNRFYIRIWFTISQQHSVQKILRKYFFNDEKDIAGSTDQLGLAELGECLHKLLFGKRTRRGNIRTCGVHDILRELCFREYNKEHLIRVPRSQLIAFQVQPKFDFCSLCGHLPDRLNRIHLRELVGLQSTTDASPLVCEACNNMYPDLNRLRWVKILDLDLFYMDTHTLVLSSEIWEIPKLRHLNVRSYRLLDPPVNDLEGQDFTILEYLSTLSSEGFKCLEEFNKLESLSLKSYSFLEDLTFPASLKKLSLSSCEIPWEKMTIIGSSLPNLEVLKLNNAFHRQEWDPTEGEFLRLKVFESAINSAMEILTEQKENGNESLRVYVNEKQVSVSL
ncbi:UNVERIFIED_CONTAM: putative disease resistance protein RGA1 [Sesamum radiatum]|uniref:Disease resistance protein RGA1 n=1 Tax=Sesamum radiatum TaxID=300843 RepID=A0AAW2WI12_SESRA